MLHELTREHASPYDTLAFNLRLEGNLDTPALCHSLTRILQRHEILRSVVDFHEEQPVQKILAAVDVKLEVQELDTALAGFSSWDRNSRHLNFNSGRPKCSRPLIVDSPASAFALFSECSE